MRRFQRVTVHGQKATNSAGKRHFSPRGYWFFRDFWPVNGYNESSIYESVKRKFWAACQAGTVPGLKVTWIHGIAPVRRHRFAAAHTR